MAIAGIAIPITARPVARHLPAAVDAESANRAALAPATTSRMKKLAMSP